MTFERVAKVRSRHVRFENAHLAYSNNERSFLVADYHELPLASESRLPFSLWLEFYLFAAFVRFRHSVSHTDLCNCFYDEKNKQLILFDAVDAMTGFWGGVLKIGKRLLRIKEANV